MKEPSRSDEDFPFDAGEELEPLSTTIDALRLMRRAVSHGRSVLIEGPVGCGKSFLIQYLASKYSKLHTSNFITVQLGEHMDGKALLGTYQCTEIPGEFTWIPGPLTKALCEGRWLLLEDLSCAPADALSSLVSVLECRKVDIPGRGIVTAHPDFRLFATLRTETGSFRDDRQFIYNQNWVTVTLSPIGDDEAKRIISKRYPGLDVAIARLLEGVIQPPSAISDRRSRTVSLRDTLKLCSRIHRIGTMLNPNGNIDTVAIFREAADCLCSHVRKSDERQDAFIAVAAKLNVSRETARYYFELDHPTMNLDRKELAVGRIKLECKRTTQRTRSASLALTRPTRQLLERLAACVFMAEPVLLVGETGCGKTAVVQFLAQHTGTKLHVVNMSQQSENADLTGGYKPTDIKQLVKALKDRFVKLFVTTFSMMKNEKFLRDIENCFNSSGWDVLVEVMRIPAKKGVDNKDDTVCSQWKTFLEDVVKLESVLKHCGDGLAFNYVEGVLVKALKQGDWILLDEINLASPEAIDCLYTLLDVQSRNLVAFGPKSSLEPVHIHPNFRLFACMNPSGDVGKKELPVGIRNRFTEFFVTEPDSPSDLHEIVSFYLNGLSFEPQRIANIVDLYLALKSPNSTSTNWPCYSLRTLCRAMGYARSNPYANVVRSVYEACCLSFLTELDSEAYNKVEESIKRHIIGKDPQAVTRFLKQPVPPPPGGKYVKVQGYWLKCGRLEESVDKKYCLTPTVKRNLRDIARAVAARNFPVLLQGETSVGKTSLITYLALLTGNKCVRINNHEHTDIQEYVGTYANDENGKLTFVEGPLVKAMRNGDWIILDELNLSPPDILEALNRVLDDNRELFVAETQETIRAHPDFILFATQNPAGAYGGRKMLSRAFRNRFIELRFNELPHKELKDILQHRCSLPPSYAQKMVNVMRDLQINRSKSGVFEGRESYMTLRDLFRWGERYRLASSTVGHFEDWEQYLADQGYLLLGCRARREEDEHIVRNVLEKHFSRSVDVDKLFSLPSPYFPRELTKDIPGFGHMVWTLETRRLAVLIGQALRYSEPVLLVGETGCGKTTLCQLLAAAKEKTLKIVNCHLMTEAADFLGRLAPASADKRENGILFEWRDGALVGAMRSGDPVLIDEISLADDSVLERLNSVLEPERSLLLAEKGSNHDGSSEVVRAADGFSLMATMNPGGDYGKKELSRALRNRFTELWCRSICNTDDIIRIVEHNLRQDLHSASGNTGLGQAILQFVSWFADNCPPEYGRLVSLRDVLDWVKFVNSSCTDTTPLWMAYVHGGMVAFIDGLGGNKSSADQLLLHAFRSSCVHFLIQKVSTVGIIVSIADVTSGHGALTLSKSHWGSAPFFINLGPCQLQLDHRYSFDTLTCRKNLFRLLRAMQLKKPILLEGSPGVGKTSLVSALAKATGQRLTRINLSEQTDLSDLFGCELPAVTTDGQQAFEWVDGSFLSALKAGHWILIDEMNLASQSVLEGLNACFDHRGEIYVPELDRSFKVDTTNTRFFACQNPHGQGGSRKGLPKSFLNRFSTILVEPLGIEDQEMILANLFPGLHADVLKKMIRFNEEVNDAVCSRREWGQSGSPWEFNLRDLMRWCEITVEEDQDPAAFVDLIYSSRFRSIEDRRKVLSACEQIFGHTTVFEPSLHFCVTPEVLQVGDAILRRANGESPEDDTSSITLCRTMLKPLRYLIHCVNRRQLAILVGKGAVGKTCLVKTLAALSGRRLRTVYLNCDSDSSDLLGSFEQTLDDSALKRVKRSLVISCRGNEHAVSLARKFDGTAECFDQIIRALRKAGDYAEAEKVVVKLKMEWLEYEQRGKKLQFTWIDSPLVQALKSGDWILLENVNYCSPAVLDRLNALLEPGGELIVTERGFVDGKIPTYKPHQDFRIFFTMDPTYGSISRAMRNRGIEICLLEEESWCRDSVDVLHVLTTETGDFAVSKELASEFHTQMENGQYAGVRRLLQKAFEASTASAYTAECGVTTTPVFKALDNVEFQGHVPVSLAKKHPIGVCVVRDASYLVQLIRESECDWTRVLAGLKQFLLRATQEDLTFRVELVDYLRAQDLNSFARISPMWVQVLEEIILPLCRDNSTVGFDWRWNWHMGRLVGRNTNVAIDTNAYAIFNKRFLWWYAKWILVENVRYHDSESLYALVTSAIEAEQRDDIPTAVFQVVSVLECLPRYCAQVVSDASVVCQLDEKVLTILSSLHAFAKAFCGKRIDPHLDTDTLRLYWMWLSNCLGEFMASASNDYERELRQLCQSIDRYWSSEKLDWKLYISIRHWLSGTGHVTKTEAEAVVKCFLVRAAAALNDVFVKAIIYDQKAARKECGELQRGILEAASTLDSQRLEQMEGRIGRLACELCDDSETRPVFCRWDIPLRKLSILGHLRVSCSNERDIGGSLRSLLPFRATFECAMANIQGPQVLLLHILDHCLMPIRSDGLAQYLEDIESIGLKVCHLESLPMETLAVVDLLKTNIKCGSIQTNISHLPRFLAEIEHFSAYFWQAGIFVGTLEQRIKDILSPLMAVVRNGLLASMEPFLDTERVAAHFNVVRNLNISCEDEPSLFYENCAHLGHSLCALSAPPANCIDPVVKERTKIDWLNEQLRYVEMELECLNGQYELLTGRHIIEEEVKVDNVHPYAVALVETRKKLIGQLALLNNEELYRPKQSQFDAIGRKMREFVESTGNVFLRIRNGVCRASDMNTNEQKMLLATMQNWLRSSEFFQRDLDEHHSAYPDVTLPFSLGLYLLRFVVARWSLNVWRMNAGNSASAEAPYLQVSNVTSACISMATNAISIDALRILPIRPSFSFVEYAFCRIRDDEQRRGLLLTGFERLLAAWSDHQEAKRREKETVTYEYKPRAPLEVEQQENQAIKALFPLPPNEDEETDILDEDCGIDGAVADEGWFARIAGLLLRKFKQSSFASGNVWPLYESFLTVCEHFPNLIVEGDQAASLPIHLLALGCVRRWLCRGGGGQALNVYKEWDLDEAAKFERLANELIKAAEYLLIEWPENEALALICQRAKTALNAPASSTVMALAVRLERLLFDAEQWEKVASRDVKLESQLHPLRSLLLSWRKMEVSCWERLLDDADLEFEHNGSLSLLQFAVIFKSWMDGGICDDDVLKSCTQLLEASPVGEFSGRAELAKALLDVFCSSGTQNKATITLKLRNVIRYYSQYCHIVQANAKKKREPIEKELKEFLKIVKFQDLNIWSIRKSATDAHRKLFRLVKQYKDILADCVATQLDPLPVTPFTVHLSDDVPLPSAKCSLPAKYDNSLFKSVEHLSKADVYYDRLVSLNSDLQSLCGTCSHSTSESIDRLKDVAEETAAFLSTPIPYAGTEEEKTKLFKRTLQQRQKAVMNLFGVLRDEGFSYRKGTAMEEGRLNDSCFLLPLVEFGHEDDRWTNICETSERCYWAALSRKLAFEDARGKPHEQIEPQTAIRCFGFTQLFTSLLVDVQKRLLAGANSLQDVTSLYEAVRALKEDLETRGRCVDQKEGKNVMQAVDECLLELYQNLEQTQRVWQCCPKEIQTEAAVIAVGTVPDLCTWTSSGEEYQAAMALLEEVRAKISSANQEFQTVRNSVLARGFISWSQYEKISNLTKALLPTSASIECLIKNCTVAGVEENFLSTPLLEARRNLGRLAESLESTNVTASIFNETDWNGVISVADSLTKKVMLATQQACKSTAPLEANGTAAEKLRCLISLVGSEGSDGVQSSLVSFMDVASKYNGSHLLDIVSTVSAFVERHVELIAKEYRLLLGLAASFYTFFCIIVESWTKIVKSGYLEPVPLYEKGGENGSNNTQFKDIENAGLGEGEGVTDVSDQITDAGQIEELKNKTQSAEEEEKEQKMEDIEKPIEMEDDFEAQMEDVKQNETGESDEEDDGEQEQEPEMDWKEGDVEAPEDEQLDPGLWEQPPDEKENHPPLDDDNKGADKRDDSVVAKENQQRDDGGDDGDGQNADEEMEGNEEEKPEEEFDLENLNLENQSEHDSEDENEGDGDDIGEDECKDNEYNEELEEMGVDETTENTGDDSGAAAEKTYSAAGVSNSSQQGDAGEKENEEREINETCDQAVDQAQNDQTRESGQEHSEEAKNDASGQVGKETKSSKRSSPAMEKQPTKRQRLADEQKTMGEKEEALCAVDIEADETLDKGNMDSEKADSSSFAHHPDVGEEGVEVVDAASVETALKQPLEQRRAIMRSEKESEKEESKMNIENSKDVEPSTSQKENGNESDVDMDEVGESGSAANDREKRSTIHTVTDFYTRAANINFDDLLKSNLDLTRGTVNVTDETKAVWYKYLSITERFALELTENLRLALEPTVASKLQGDYRSGKRLNIRKLVPYIASQFRKNKIWLRRTKKAKRDYQILLAIDDSASMKDNMSMDLAFGSLALLSTALRHLEVGQLGVCKFGASPELLHRLDSQFVDSSGPSVISQLMFEQQKTNVAELLEFASTYFAQETNALRSRRDDGPPAQLLLIVSDGRGIFAEGVERVKAAVQKTLKLNIFTIFLILDNPTVKHSILDIKSLYQTVDGRCEVRPYLETFPFPFYIILRQVAALPAVMGDALRQWFEFVVSQQ